MMLKVNILSAGYGRLQVLYRVALEVGSGETVALLGRNGAGKTTLLRAISGLIRVADGTIEFEGKNIRNVAPHIIARDGIIQVSSTMSVFNGHTVIENLRLGALRFSVSRTQLKQDVDSILELFPMLVPLKCHLAESLSGGERRMLALGQALMAKPRLLLLDEPSHGLAPVMVNELYKVIDKLRNQGNAILLAEQFPDMALSACDRAYVIEHGETVLNGTRGELSRSDSILQAYLGTSVAKGSA